MNMDMKFQITEEQKHQLDASGFFVTPKLFDESVLAEVRAAFGLAEALTICRGASDDKAVENSFYTLMPLRLL